MPQTVSINATKPGGEIKQLHTHGEKKPCDNETGPNSPHALRLPISFDTEICPENVLRSTHHHVGRHVVGVVPVDELEVEYMANVKANAEHSPEAKE